MIDRGHALQAYPRRQARFLFANASVDGGGGCLAQVIAGQFDVCEQLFGEEFD